MSWEDYSAEQNKKNPFENHACGFRQGKEYQIIMEKTEIPVIDVIIPAYRPDDSFHKLIRLLLEQSVKPHHIYVLQTIEDGEQVLQPLDQRMSVHPVPKKEFDHGATRDYGAGLAVKDIGDDISQHYILFMTQDAVPAGTELLERLVKPFGDDRTAITYARQLAREEADLLERLTRVHNYPPEDQVKSKEDLERLGIKTYFCSDVCAMYRLDRYMEQGGFVHPTIFNEDMIMASRMIQAGYQVVYCGSAEVFHSHNYSCMQQFHRNFDLGVSQKQYREVFESISSEKEGAGYAKSTLLYLLKRGKPGKAFYFALQCGFKLIGYKLGKNYDHLPRKMVLWCTMTPGYVLFHQDE